MGRDRLAATIAKKNRIGRKEKSTVNNDKQPWEIWYEKYRGTELVELVIHLTRIALERGEITAEDSHCIPVKKSHSIRGAAICSMRGLNIIRAITVTQGTTKASHHHTMYRWQLADPLAAQSLLRAAQKAVLHKKPETSGQLLLAV